MVKSFRSVVCLVLMLFSTVSISAFAKEPPIYTALFSNTAISGYDPVAYFIEQRPVKGLAQFSANFKGAEWRFSNAENRDKFLSNPEQYAPQYGGYCAWAVAQGYTASGDPLRWKIVDNKLFLNYDADVQKKWEKNIPEFIKAGDKNWPTVLGK
jgi:YHS domain-containing protein